MSYKRASQSDPNRFILIKLGFSFYDATFHINHLDWIE